MVNIIYIYIYIYYIYHILHIYIYIYIYIYNERYADIEDIIRKMTQGKEKEK